MRRRMGVGVLAVLVMLAALLAAACGGDEDAAATDTPSTDRTVTVNGEGRVARAPDVVMMTLGVDIREADLASAQSRATTTMQAVIDGVKGQGITEEDIETATYAIYVERDYTKADQPVIAYHVTHMVTVTGHDVARAGEVLQSAVDAGANTIQGVYFALEDTTAAVKEARELAVANAKAKAEELTRLTGSQLGGVKTISESVNVPTSTSRDKGEGTGAGAPVIPSGQTEVIVTVTVAYVIE